MPPLNIIIVGAGIAGLTAALALRQNGHRITILEKSLLNQESGAAIMVGANVSGLLADMGFDHSKAGANKCEGRIRFDKDGNVTQLIDIDVFAKHWKNQWLLSHRIDLHAELKREVMDVDRPGLIPELILGTKISHINVEDGVLQLEDGRQFVGDLIIGADGNRSQTRLEIKPDAKLVPWGKKCYRWLIPRDALVADPETNEVFGRRGHFGEVIDDDRRLVFYPCRQNTELNVVAFVPDEVADANIGLSNKEVVLKAYDGCFPAVRKALALAHDDIKVWELYDMENLPSWYKGRLVLIGDAAHPFLPFAGQGGAMAMEDSICLGVIFHENTLAADVPERLRLYQHIRYQRATFVQDIARTNGLDENKKPKGFDIKMELGKLHHFDEKENSGRKLEEWKAQRATLNGNIW